MAWGGFGWLEAWLHRCAGLRRALRGLDCARLPRPPRLQPVVEQRKCLHLYHYYEHPVLGRCHVRLQTWYPFQRERLPQRLALAGSPNGPFPGRNLTLRLWRAHWIPKLPIMVVAWCAMASTGVTGLLFIVSVWLTPHSPEKLMIQMFDLQLLTFPIWILQGRLRLDVSAELTPPPARRIWQDSF